MQKTANGSVKDGKRRSGLRQIAASFAVFCNGARNRLTINSLNARKRQVMFAGVFLCFYNINVRILPNIQCRDAKFCVSATKENGQVVGGKEGTAIC